MRFSILLMFAFFGVVSISSSAMDNVEEKNFHQYGLVVNNCLKNFISGIKVEKPLDHFVKFSNSLHAGKVKSTDHLPIWGILAETYLEIASVGFQTDQQKNEAEKYFKPEILEKLIREKATFEWFLIYCDRLSILITLPEEREVIDEVLNVNCCSYKNALLRTIVTDSGGKKQSWLRDETYRFACQMLSSQYTKDVHSPLALTRQFPDIVMLPFPFELTAKDIWTTLPTPNRSHFWGFGLSAAHIKADGADFKPLRFYMHDQFHLSQYIHYLNKGDLFVFIPGSINSPKDKAVWDDIRYCKQIWFEIVEKLQEDRLKHESSEDSDQWIMNDFFMFFCTHETVEPLVGRLQWLAQGAFGKVPLTPEILFGKDDSLLNDTYYLPLLTESLKEAGSFDKRVEIAESIMNDFISNPPTIDEMGSNIYSIPEDKEEPENDHTPILKKCKNGEYVLSVREENGSISGHEISDIDVVHLNELWKDRGDENLSTIWLSYNDPLLQVIRKKGWAISNECHIWEDFKKQIHDRLSEIKKKPNEGNLEKAMKDFTDSWKALTGKDSQADLLYKEERRKSLEEFCRIFNEHQKGCKEWIDSVVLKSIEKINQYLNLGPLWQRQLNCIKWMQINSIDIQIYAKDETIHEFFLSGPGNEFVEKDFKELPDELLKIIRFYPKVSALSLDAGAKLSKNRFFVYPGLKGCDVPKFFGL